MDDEVSVNLNDSSEDEKDSSGEKEGEVGGTSTDEYYSTKQTSLGIAKLACWALVLQIYMKILLLPKFE